MYKVIQIMENVAQNAIREIYIGASSTRICMFPRYDLQKFMLKEYSNDVGVYILYNEITGSKGLAYVGETENISERLQQHDRSMSKLFWTHVIILQDRCGNLNKAYCKYIEYMLYTYLCNAERVTISNSVVPTKSSLSVTDKIIADTIINTLREVCVSLNIRMLEPIGIGAFEEDSDLLYLECKGVVAKLRVIDKNTMYLVKGSICCKPEIVEPKYQALLEKCNTLFKLKKVKQIADTIFYELLEDIKFDSEVEAASFALLQDTKTPVENLWHSFYE